MFTGSVRAVIYYWIGIAFSEMDIHALYTQDIQLAFLGIAVIAILSGKWFLNELMLQEQMLRVYCGKLNVLLVMAIMLLSYFLPVLLGPKGEVFIGTFVVCFTYGMFQRVMGWMRLI